MKLLIDNNLPPALAQGLHALFDGQHHVEHIRSKFGTGSLPDEEWIERLGGEGNWCVLSGDRRIATKRPSRELFLRSNLLGFFPLPAVMRLPLPAQAARLLTVWPLLEATSKTRRSGCFEIGVRGSTLRSIG